MSWVSPSMTSRSATSSSSSTSSTKDSTTTSTQQERTPPPPPINKLPVTPDSVANLNPATCLALSDFKDLMRQYRALDDGITTRLNRSFARYRDMGGNSSPSLLSSSSSTSSVKDLGISTYSKAPQEACSIFWKELVKTWVGREEVIKYCVGFVDREAGVGDLPSRSPSRSSTALSRPEDRLDADLSQQASTAVQGGPNLGRGEAESQVLRRQLHNELYIESIVRKRSLDAFKSRCRFFQPTFSQDPQGEREKAMWDGNETPSALAIRRRQFP
ncbi:hypothetical protein IE53DRAFT_178804 [Violaceomyces palustris]|uniref:Uncharacterized protein n=1 Tax=Violaceomyces palustris TaxID=1673888 RepID=A0ACD0NSF5_9BASI|nr:hypothetical protein IE53DRAFT_178804 [Violaceomyces palustris]